MQSHAPRRKSQCKRISTRKYNAMSSLFDDKYEAGDYIIEGDNRINRMETFQRQSMSDLFRAFLLALACVVFARDTATIYRQFAVRKLMWILENKRDVCVVSNVFADSRRPVCEVRLREMVVWEPQWIQLLSPILMLVACGLPVIWQASLFTRIWVISKWLRHRHVNFY
eukprot:Gregarina_sp_Pseudo_9__466@NODE_12_length_6581_cov_71_440079_g10_i0_p6_GENE_NODE_12_length_6581_cov_71_440079_g10_i0NODE_12_length_6581_cov_71_440079_g10_i0_p6_ORF_typecomplete_len169_score14_51DUF5562/PF17717_1/0_24_NODE_12_length_6581_cov_71_440079_g10_i016352141